MTKSTDKLNNTKDKLFGEVKNKFGKVTGNEEMELEGKVQSLKSDVTKKAAQLKEDAAEKLNDIFDGKK